MMNNYPFFIQPDNTAVIVEELRKVNDTLIKIEKALNSAKENKYLEKDDNYYII